MTKEEVINSLELLKAEIEWDHSLEYQTTIDAAIQMIKHDREDAINDFYYMLNNQFAWRHDMYEVQKIANILRKKYQGEK